MARQLDINILREAITKLTQMLADKGIVVTQRGAQAYVKCDRKGKILSINLPHLPDNATQDVIAAIHGFLDHEVGHVLFTDFKIVALANKISKIMGNLHNIVEDVFVEAQMRKRFPGSQYNLEQVADFFIKKVILPQFVAADTPQGKMVAMAVPIVRALGGQPVFKRFVDDNMTPEVAKLNSLLEPFSKRISNLKNSAECLQVAKEIHAILYPPKPPAPKPPTPKPPPPMTPPPPPELGEPGDDETGDDEGESDGPSGNEDADPDKVPEETNPSGDDDDEELPTENPEAGDEGDDSEGGDEGDDEGETSSGDDDETGDDETGDDETEANDDETGDDETEANSDEEAGEEGDDIAGDGGSGEDEGDEEGDEDEPGAGTKSEKGEGEDEDATGEEGSEESGSDEEGEPEDENAEPAPEEDTPEGAPSGETPNAEKGEDFIPSAMFEDAKDFDEAVADEMASSAAAAMRDSPYVVFTTDDDKEEVYVPQIVYPNAVIELDDKVRQMVGVMQKDIERMMASRSRTVWQPGLRSGRLHSAALTRLKVGDDRVFRRKIEHKSTATAVTQLIDCSGSMSGSKFSTACMAAYAMAQTLERIGIKNEILGFTTHGWTGGRTNARETEVEEEGRRLGITFSRWEPIYMPIFKTFDERLTAKVKERLANAFVGANPCFLTNNIDGESVMMAARRLGRRSETRKVLIVLSDGYPYCDGNTRALNHHLKQSVTYLENSGMDVVGIGIEDDAVRNFYKRHVVLNNVSELPGRIMSELRKML